RQSASKIRSLHKSCEPSAHRSLNSTLVSDFCNALQRLSKDSTGIVGGALTVLSLAVEGSALASCCSAGFSCTAAVCCGWLLGVSLFGATFLADSVLGGSLDFDFAAAKVSIWDASFAFGVAVDP